MRRRMQCLNEFSVVYTNSVFLLLARRKAAMRSDRLAHLTEYGVGNHVLPYLA